MTNNSFKKDVLLYYFPPFGYAFLVFYLSSLPSWKLEKVKHLPDYLLHFTEYAIFAWLVLRFVHKLKGKNLKFLQYMVVISVLTIFAISDEWHQSLVPGRDANFYDFLSDFSGTTVAIGIYIAYKRYYIEKR